jgi:hypothetical protein
MGFWPFGRDPANVEIVSRVVTATAQNGFRVRAKLTVHFLEPQRQGDADEAADRCAAVAVALLREAPDHESVIGGEARLSAELLARYPSVAARPRFLELASVHVVGDPALSDELRRAVSISQPAGPATSRPPPPANTTPNPGAVGPVSYASSGSSPSFRRRGSSQIRSIQQLLMPPGTAPAVMGQFVAPTVKDSAARLLIGFLRAHDLIAVRGASIDENSAETLAALVPASDAPPGGYEASRAAELGRWQATLGDAPMAAIRRELRTVTVYLARNALTVVEVNQTLAEAVIEGVCSSAFPEDAGLLAEATSRPTLVQAELVVAMAAVLTKMAGVKDEPGKIADAMAPLVATVQEDLGVSAMIIKASAGT